MNCLETQKKIDETWNYCLNMFGTDRCIALTLHGSQNYECDLPDSDVDSKLFITPTWEEVVSAKSMISKTIKGPFGDINVTDIRMFIGNCLMKQNFNFLECLFTPYSCVNPTYADIWEQLIEHREMIAHYDPDAAVRTMMGQVRNQYSRWNRFDNKKTLYHMMRISSAIETYQISSYFADTLIPNNVDHIMRVRRGEVPAEDMDYMFELFYNHCCHCADRFQPHAKDTMAESIMYELQRKFVLRALYELGVDD
jgi:predicted nucleotidyltransferase